MVQVVATALGVQPRSGVTLEESVLDYLRLKNLLLVLDNCEHLLAPIGELVRGVVARCASVRTLATSREGLGVGGEQLWALRSLEVPRGLPDPEQIAASEAVRLLVERGRAVRPGFSVDAGNAAAVIEICRRLDGIPLAIELAAARLSSMNPADIVNRLDERFRLLTGGRSTAVERHQTLRATVEWSYSILTSRERVVFDRLGVFAGSFDAAAAEAVVADSGLEGWDVLDALRSLVDKSLVAIDDDTGGSVRYEMLETLRQYAREQLDETGTADVWRRSHADYYAQLAEIIGPGLISADESAWRPRLLVELDNLRSAVTWSFDGDAAADHDLGCRVIAALGYESNMNRALGIGAWAERARPFVDQSTFGRRNAVLGAAAWGALSRGDPAAARDFALDAMRDGIPPDSPTPIAAPVALSLSYIMTGDPDEALRVLGETATALRPDDLFAQTVLLTAEASFRAMAGDSVGARGPAQRGVELARELGNPSALALSFNALGQALQDDDPDAAQTVYDESAALTRSGASDVVLPAALMSLARLQAMAGDIAGGLRGVRDALTHAEDVGDRGGVMSGLVAVLEIFIEAQEPKSAAVLAGAISRGPMADAARNFVLAKSAVQRARGLLDDQGYAEGAGRGAAMPYDKLLTYTLREIDRLLEPV